MFKHVYFAPIRHVLQVEALRDNLQLVGAQKVLHEQQAEMWKQKHAAMEKLVDHLELLVASQQKQLTEQQLSHVASPQAMPRETRELPKLSPPGAADDPDHVHQNSPRHHLSAATKAGCSADIDSLFEYVVLLGARDQDLHDALRVSGLAQVQHVAVSPKVLQKASKHVLLRTIARAELGPIYVLHTDKTDRQTDTRTHARTSQKS